MNIIKSLWPAPQNIHAFCTTRVVNVASEDGRRELCASLALPSEPFWMEQQHTGLALEVSEQQILPIGDASFTDRKNKICIVKTADCLPLLMCNRQGTEVAAIHAGWRGLSAGIIENTVRRMKSKPADLLVWLGPAISQNRYEVGPEVYQAFVESHSENHQAFSASARPGHYYADLYQLGRLACLRLNVTEIYGGEYCTYRDENLFFSARRESGKTGRLGSFIWYE